jgi:hypothetical protein
MQSDDGVKCNIAIITTTYTSINPRDIYAIYIYVPTASHGRGCHSRFTPYPML